MHEFAGSHPYVQVGHFGNQKFSEAIVARVPYLLFETEKKHGGWERGGIFQSEHDVDVC